MRSSAPLSYSLCWGRISFQDGVERFSVVLFLTRLFHFSEQGKNSGVLTIPLRKTKHQGCKKNIYQEVSSGGSGSLARNHLHINGRYLTAQTLSTFVTRPCSYHVFNGFGHNNLRARARVILFPFMFRNPCAFFSHKQYPCTRY